MPGLVKSIAVNLGDKVCEKFFLLRTFVLELIDLLIDFFPVFFFDQNQNKKKTNEHKKVNEGQELCVIEAMKMQNSLVAESSGKVIKINCKVGETVDGDQVLLQLE